MSTRDTIAKNASVMFVTQLVTWGLSLLLTVFMPRYLGAAAIGQFHTANSLWAIAAIMMAFGMDRLLTKDIARDTTKAGSMLGLSIILRLLLSVLAFAGMLLFLILFDYPLQTRQVVMVVGVSSVLWQVISALEATGQGLERMEIASLGVIVAKTLQAVVSIFLLLQGYGVVVIAGVTVLAAATNLTVQSALLSRHTPIRPRLETRAAVTMLRAGAPYLASALFMQIYMQFDIVILSLLTEARVVGWYGAADVLFGTFLFVPTVFVNAVFPALSRLYAQASDSMARVARKSFDLLLVASFPVGFGLVAIADPAVLLLYGEQFRNSGPVLALFGIVTIFTYMNMLLGRYLISMDRQNQFTAVMAVCTIIKFPIDLTLIPFFQRQYGNGGVGGALSFILVEMGMMVAMLLCLPRGLLDRHNSWLAARALVAGLVMLAVVWPLRYWFIAIPVAVGVVVYATLVWAFRLFCKEDQQMFREIIQKVLHRLRRSSPQPQVGSPLS